MSDVGLSINRLSGDQKMLLYAVSLFREGRIDEAQREAEAVLRANDKSVSAHLAVGVTYLIRQRAREALYYFNRATELDAMASPPLFLAGLAYLTLGDLDRAEISLRGALDLDDQLPTAHFFLAQAMQRRGDHAAAAAQIEAALALDPQLKQARVLKAVLLEAAGQGHAAAEEVDLLLHFYPGQQGVAELASLDSPRSKNLDEPTRLLKAATKSDENLATSWTWLGRAKMQRGEYGEAEAAFRKARQLDAWSVVAAVGLVDSLIKQGFLREAREALGAVPRRIGTKAWVHKLQADIYAAEGKLTEAAEAYTAALLNSRGGREKALAISQEYLEAYHPDLPNAILRFQSAVEQVFTANRKQKSEQDWQLLAKRFNKAALADGQKIGPRPPSGGKGAQMIPDRPNDPGE